MSYQRDFLARKLRDPQAKFVHDLAQIQANQAADNVANITSNLKGYSVKLQTKSTSKDKYYASIHDYDNRVFYTGKYPDFDNCRVFIRTENAGKLHDYSLMGQEAYSYGTRQVPDIYIKEDPRDPAKHEFVSYWNGTHYVNIRDSAKLNLKSIVENETKDGFSFVRRLLPMKYGNSKQESVILATHTSTSQNQYAYNLTLDEDGNFYFYIKYNYKQYFVKLEATLELALTQGPDFFYENFKSKNFKTDLQTVLLLAKQAYDIGCTFNFTTKEAVIELRHYDTETNIWSMIARVSSVDEEIPDKQIDMPLQEGKWSAIEATPLNQVYDASDNQLIGTINDPENILWNSDNTFNHQEDAEAGVNITIPNDEAFNTFTEMTLSFWYKPTDNITLTNRIFMIGYDNTAHVKVHRTPENGLNFSMSINADGTGSQQVEYDNAFPELNQWYFVTCKWKSGEPKTISINNGADAVDNNTLTGTFTELTRPFTIYDWRPDNAVIINAVFFTRKITTLEQTKLYSYGPHLSQLAKNLEPQQTPQENPPPITVPYSTLYDLPPIGSPSLLNYLFLNDPSADSPFESNYNCPDGTPFTTNVEVKYNVPEGTGGTTENPPVEIYNLAPASSTGDLGNNELAYVQRIQSPSSALIGVAIYEIQGWIDSNDDADGDVYLGVIKSDGSYITFGTAVSGSSLGGGWLSVTKTNASNGYIMQNGDGIGVIWLNNSSGTLYIRRGGTDNHDDPESGSPYSWQHTHSGSSWNSNNDQYSMAGIVKKSGGTTGTSPYFTFLNPSSQAHEYPSMCGEFFGTNSTMKDQIPTKVELKVYKKASTTGSISLQIFTSSNAVKATLTSWNVGTDPNIPTTAPAAGVLNLVWENVNNEITIANGEKLMLVATSMSTNGEIYVMTNSGNTSGSNNYHSSTSYFVSRLRGFGSFGLTWTNHTSLDLTGKISIGGQSFTAYEKFSNTQTRIYERAITGSSSFEGQMITQVKVRGRRVGTIPNPVTIFCYIRRQSDNQIQETIGSMDANEIGVTLEDIFFTNRGADHIVNIGDYISIEITSCNASNYIELNVNTNVADSGNSVLGVWSGGAHNNLSNYDLAGTFFTGGQIDEESRIRVGQYINTQDSIFMTADSSQITYMELRMIKVGTPTGNFFVNIRNENDTAIKTLHSGPVGDLSAVVNSPTIVFVNDLGNTYNLRAKDKITVEYDGGDADNKIGVMVRLGTGYDGTHSHIARYNGIEYDFDETRDLVAVMKTGGFTYEPDPFSLPPNMPQLSTDIYLGVRADKQGIYERSISSLFMFTTEILTTEDFDNFCKIRMDFVDLEPQELLVTHHSFIHAE